MATTVAAVFCAPEKEGARADPLKTAALERNLPVHQFASLKSPGRGREDS